MLTDNISNILLALFVVLAGLGLHNWLYTVERTHTVVGTVYAPDALFYMNRTLILVDDKLVVTTCDEQELATKDRFEYAECLDTSHVGDGYALVKQVKPQFKAQVRAAMAHSIVMDALEIEDGNVLQ